MAGVAPRGSWVLSIAVVLAFVMAGCLVVGDEGEKTQVIKSYSRQSASTSGETLVFSIGEGVDEIRISYSTKPKEKSSDIPGCDWCGDWDDDDDVPSGSVRFVVQDPNQRPADAVPLGFDDTATSTIPNPAAGSWAVSVQYLSGYDGPAAFSVARPVAGGGANSGFLGGGSFLDLLGVILAVGTLIGGWFLLRRRTRSLTRELHRIDAAFHRHNEDVDECRQNLQDMRGALKDMLIKRKIEENQYLILERRIDQYLVDLETPGNRYDEPRGKQGIERIRRA